MEVEMEDVDHPSEDTGDTPPTPRERLEQLLLVTRFDRRGEGHDVRAMEREIIELARTHPEVFAEDIVPPNRQTGFGNPEEDRRSPLNYLMTFFCRNYNFKEPVNIDVFEAVYSAYPAAIDSVDSFDDTVLLELLQGGRFKLMKRGGEKAAAVYRSWLDLLKSVISKSNSLLSLCGTYHTPIIKALEKGCDEEVVRYMINHHPGDPFREQGKDGRTLLGAAVKSRFYSFDFIKYIFDQYPEAVQVRETNKYQGTVFHSACSWGNEAVLRLFLSSFPKEPSVPVRRKELPLQAFFGHGLDFELFLGKINKNSVAMVAFAYPKAIFQNTYSSKKLHQSTFSPFSLIADQMLERHREDPGRNEQEDVLLWSYLNFFMNAFCHKSGTIEAWNPPQYPVHAAARCPCPSDFLIHMAKERPDQLSQFDSEGRSVLALALESGHSTCRGYDKENCISELVQVNPSVIGLCDPKTRLYPFMTAACSEDQIAEMAILNSWIADDGSDYGKEKARECREAASLTCLNTIYFLLQADPSRVLPA